MSTWCVVTGRTALSPLFTGRSTAQSTREALPQFLGGRSVLYIPIVGDSAEWALLKLPGVIARWRVLAAVADEHRALRLPRWACKKFLHGFLTEQRLRLGASKLGRWRSALRQAAQASVADASGRAADCAGQCDLLRAFYGCPQRFGRDGESEAFAEALICCVREGMRVRWERVSSQHGDDDPQCPPPPPRLRWHGLCDAATGQSLPSAWVDKLRRGTQAVGGGEHCDETLLLSRPTCTHCGRCSAAAGAVCRWCSRRAASARCAKTAGSAGLVCCTTRAAPARSQTRWKRSASLTGQHRLRYALFARHLAIPPSSAPALAGTPLLSSSKTPTLAAELFARLVAVHAYQGDPERIPATLRGRGYWDTAQAAEAYETCMLAAASLSNQS